MISNGKTFGTSFVWFSQFIDVLNSQANTHRTLWSQKPTYLPFMKVSCSKYSPTTYTSTVINQSIKSRFQSITSSHTCTYCQLLLMRGLKPGGKSKVLISLCASSERAACSSYGVLINVRYQMFLFCLERKWILNYHFGRILACFEKLQAFSCHHRISVMELGHLLTRSGLTYPELNFHWHSTGFQSGLSVFWSVLRVFLCVWLWWIKTRLSFAVC